MRRSENVRGGAVRFFSFVGMLGVIVGGFAWKPASAELQNDAVGFTPNHIMESSNDGEHIDVLSGNLSLTIPIGPRYKLSDELTWGITLHYNSKVWDYICPCNASWDNSNLNCPVDNPVGVEMEYRDTLRSCTGVMRESDLGALGWSWLPGRVYNDPHDKPFVYRLRLEDGAEHMFCYGGSIDDRAASNCPSNGYTVDASNIKVWPIPAIPTTSNPQIGWKAFLPNGLAVEFQRAYDDDTRKGAYASRIETQRLRGDGRPAAWVDFPYGTGVLAQDSQGRIVTVSGSPTMTVSFPAYTDPVSNTQVQPVYKLTEELIALWDPTDYSQFLPADATDYFLTQLDRHRTVLKSIEYPSPNPQTEPYKYAFDYSIRNGATVVPSGDSESDPLSYGMLTQRTLPTGATIEYDYGFYPTSPRQPYHTELVKKTLFPNIADRTKNYQWTWSRLSVIPYGATVYPDPGNPAIHIENPLHPTETQNFRGSNPYRVVVRDPFNNLTVYQYSSTLYDTSTTVCNAKGECPNVWSDGLLQSMLTYAGPGDTSHLVKRVDYTWDSEMGEDSDGNPLHKMFQYRAPLGNQNPPIDINAVAINVHQVEEKTTIPGQTSHTVAVDSSNWYGNDEACFLPRQRDEYVDGVLYRSTVIGTDPDPAANGGNCGANLYTEVRDRAGNVVSRVDRKYSKGRLLWEVHRKGTDYCPNTGCTADPQVHPGDVATVNNFDDADTPPPPNATGAITETQMSGGDGPSADLRLTTMTYATYSEATGDVNTGYLKTKNFGFHWNAVDRNIDLNTGWTKSTTDPAGNATTYSYDGLGRLTAIYPHAPEAPTLITYTHINETHVKQMLPSGDFTESAYYYDYLGRLIRTTRRTAIGGTDEQLTQYDIAGRVTAKSEWAPLGGPYKWTTYDYTIYMDPITGAKYTDPLGRVHGVTTPDDLTPETPTTETTYDGDVTTVRVRDIRGLVNGESASVTSTTTYTKDALGRLISVQSPGGGASATYSYDENDNLIDVRLTDLVNAYVQERRFEYDRLGRLRTATNPESGTTVYRTYDSRGNLTSYSDAQQNIFTIVYDDADRVLYSYVGVYKDMMSSIYDEMTGNLSSQSSTRSNDDGSELVSTTWFHYGPPNSSQIENCNGAADSYKGLNGRLMWQKNQFSDWSDIVETDYCQDARGMTTMVTYPDYPNTGRTRSNVLSSYASGYLTGMNDIGRARPYINNVRYGTGGVPTQLDRLGNSDVIALDVRNRPSEIKTAGFAATSNAEGVSCIAAQGDPDNFPEFKGFPCDDPNASSNLFSHMSVWDSGTYLYDMAGNVTSIGVDQYYYDPLNRLIQSSIVANGTVYVSNFNYDAFGNMINQSRVTDTTLGSPLTRAYTLNPLNNRLIGQMIGSSAELYTYNANGNIISQGPTTGATGYVYDGRNQLRQVLHPEKGVVGDYEYDNAGHRVKAVMGGNEIYYVRDPAGQVLSEFQRPVGSTATPAWNKDYVYAFGKPLELIKNQEPSAPQRPRVLSCDAVNGTLTLAWDPVPEQDVHQYIVNQYIF